MRNVKKATYGLILGMVATLSTATAFATHQKFAGMPIVNVLVNGNPLKSDVPAFLVEGRTMMPVRAIAEALGANVQWDGELSTVHITTQPNQTPAIATQASAALQAIRQRNWNALALLVHPDKGIRFSPYGHVKTGAGEDQIRTAGQIRAGFTDSAVIHWGEYDGSGEPIDLSFEAYYQRFIYSADFALAPVVAYNRIAGRGNTLINMHGVYPQGQFIEYHFPGFDPQFGGMDWQSLRLVFEETAGNWYLVGIIHDQWTS
jgi:hypothetical protein